MMVAPPPTATVARGTDPAMRALQRRRRRWVWRIGLAFVVVLGAALLVRAWLPQPEAVVLGAVTRGRLHAVVTEQGRTRVRHRYVITAPASGDLDRIHVEPGDAIAQGETVARLRSGATPLIEPRQWRAASARVEAALAAARRARADVERARTERDFAIRERDRILELANAAAVGLAEVDEAHARARVAGALLDAAEMGVRASDADVATARAALSAPGAGHRELVHATAPVPGRILSVLHRGPGFVVSGTPLLEIGDLADLEIVVGLLTRDAARVNPTTSASIDAGTGASWPAVVRRIEPSGYTRLSALGVEEQRVDVVLDWGGAGAPPAGMGDGYRVDVSLTVFDAPNTLRAPGSALFRHGTGWAVFVVEGGRAFRRAVVIGERAAHDVEVLEGLDADANVVLHPSDRIRDGVAVTAVPLER